MHLRAAHYNSRLRISRNPGLERLTSAQVFHETVSTHFSRSDKLSCALSERLFPDWIPTRKPIIIIDNSAETQVIVSVFGIVAKLLPATACGV